MDQPQQPPNLSPEDVEKMIAQHRTNRLYNILAQVRTIKIDLFLLDADGPLEVRIAETLHREFEQMATLCLPKETVDNLPSTPIPQEVRPS